MNVAVVNPYYREPDSKLARCMASVAAQTHPVTHFMVADGFPRESVAAAPGVRHVVLLQAHGDNGNTPPKRSLSGIRTLNAKLGLNRIGACRSFLYPIGRSHEPRRVRGQAP